MKKHCNQIGRAVVTLVTISLLLILFIPSSFAAEPINVCMSNDYSGLSAHAGITQTKVAEMVIKDVNAAGGIKGRPIKLIIADNGSDPAKALGNAKMFKDQYKCKVMIIDITSSVCLAVKGWGEANKMVMVAGAPQSDKLTVLNQKAWFFRACSSAPLNIHATLSRLKKLGYTKAAFEGTTLAWGTDTLGIIKETAAQYGITLVHTVLVEPKTKDLSIQVKQMKESGAEAIISTEYDAETAVLARAISAIGWKPYVIHTSASLVASATGLADPKLFEGWETMTISDPTKPLVKKIWSSANAYTHGNPKIDEDEKAIRGYDAIALIVAALKAAKDPDDATSIRDAFYNIPNYERAAGKKGGKGGYTIAKNHFLDVDDMVMLTVKNGKFEVVH